MLKNQVKMHILVLLLAVLGCVAFNPVFTDSAIFERLSHFKDVGLPATLNDPVSRAMIADGSCRSVGVSDLAPFLMWSSLHSVETVLDTLSNLPDTSEPSHFVIVSAWNAL